MVLNASRGEEVGNEDQSSGGGPGGAGKFEPGARKRHQKGFFSLSALVRNQGHPSAAPGVVNRSVLKPKLYNTAAVKYSSTEGWPNS